MKRALTDYLEVLQYSGLTDWGPFTISPEHVTHIQTAFENLEIESPENIVIATEIETPSEIPLEMPKKSTSKTLSRPVALALLAAEVAQCQRCKELAAARTQTVFGTGNPNASLVFLGEAPGADEDMQGVPFVGRAGQLLNDMITKGMKIKREEVYICNILRCRPPGNRNPERSEADLCRPFLDRTLEILQPKFICCLGTIAAQNLLQSEEPIGAMRGKVYQYGGAKVICTYHPAYLLRTASAKAKTWEDLQLLMKEMGIPVRKSSGME